jgi:hypothetical protein
VGQLARAEEGFPLPLALLNNGNFVAAQALSAHCGHFLPYLRLILQNGLNCRDSALC